MHPNTRPPADHHPLRCAICGWSILYVGTREGAEGFFKAHVGVHDNTPVPGDPFGFKAQAGEAVALIRRATEAVIDVELDGPQPYTNFSMACDRHRWLANGNWDEVRAALIEHLDDHDREKAQPGDLFAWDGNRMRWTEPPTLERADGGTFTPGRWPLIGQEAAGVRLGATPVDNLTARIEALEAAVAVAAERITHLEEEN